MSNTPSLCIFLIINGKCQNEKPFANSPIFTEFGMKVGLGTLTTVTMTWLLREPKTFSWPTYTIYDQRVLFRRSRVELEKDLSTEYRVYIFIFSILCGGKCSILCIVKMQ